MMTRESHRAATPLEWVLVANAARARCYARDVESNALLEVADFVHPQSRQKGIALDTDRGGLVHKSVVSTQFVPHADPQDRSHAEFARELASYLEEAARTHRYSHLAVVSSSPFLGVLKVHLGPATLRQLQSAVALDLTAYQGAELERRVAQALPAAVPAVQA
jgi:protein required for attachment to host cells